MDISDIIFSIIFIYGLTVNALVLLAIIGIVGYSIGLVMYKAITYVIKQLREVVHGKFTKGSDC